MDLVIDFNDCPQHILDADEQQIKYRLLEQASAVGPFLIALVQSLWTEGVLSTARYATRLFPLAKRYGAEPLELACRRALFYRKTDYLTVERILRQDLHTLPLNPYTDVNGQFLLWPTELLDKCGVPNNW
jgi:hypothetical protein